MLDLDKMKINQSQKPNGTGNESALALTQRSPSSLVIADIFLKHA